MGALFAVLPQLLTLLNNPAVQALLPVFQQLLAQLGNSQFPAVDPNKALQAGSALFDVNSIKWVQTALILQGFKLEADGVYGADTKTAVSAFQKAHPPLLTDGWAGTATQDALRAELSKRSV